MELFLLRHGEAVSSAPRDQDRALSERGRQEVATIIESAKSDLANIEQVFVSPYLRAQQTLEIARSILDIPQSHVTASDALTPCGDPRLLFPLLERTKPTSTLFVTHQPLVGSFLDYICGLEPGRYSMGTSALAAIDYEVLGPGVCDLRWLKQP